MKKKIKNTSVQTIKKNVPLVYVGPNIPNLFLSKNSIHADGIPEHVLKNVKNVGALKKLFVEATDLGRALLEVKFQGYPLNVYYKKIEEEIQNKED